jgi:antitoxin ParD1/3/4
MSTMNISLPEGLKAFIDQQVEGGNYGSSSEYIRELIRKEQDRQALRSLLLEGGASLIEGEADDAFFDALRSRIVDRAAE